MRPKIRKAFLIMSFFLMVLPALLLAGQTAATPGKFNPATVIWYEHPADKWENAFPVGNGRLGAMVFGRTDEERIQLNEETYWSGGPYDQTRKGGKDHLAEIRNLIFAGDLIARYRRLFHESNLAFFGNL